MGIGELYTGRYYGVVRRGDHYLVKNLHTGFLYGEGVNWRSLRTVNAAARQWDQDREKERARQDGIDST